MNSVKSSKSSSRAREVWQKKAHTSQRNVSGSPSASASGESSDIIGYINYDGNCEESRVSWRSYRLFDVFLRIVRPRTRK